MITYYSKTKDDTAMRRLDEYANGCWVCAEGPTQNEVAELTKRFDISQKHVQDALDENMVPRLEKFGQHVYLYMRYPERDSGVVVTRPVLFILSKTSLITVSAHKMPIFDTYAQTKTQYSTSDRTRLGLALFGEIGDAYEQEITLIARSIEAIRAKLRGQVISDKDFVKFVVLEGELNDFATVMRSTAVTLRSMSSHASAFAEYKDDLQQLALVNQQAIDNCELYERAINAIRDAYSTLSSNRLNQTMTVLTVATLFVALPTSLYSMYGMNVPLPIQNEPWAFVLIFALSLAIPLAVLWLVRRRRLL